MKYVIIEKSRTMGAKDIKQRKRRDSELHVGAWHVRQPGEKGYEPYKPGFGATKPLHQNIQELNAEVERGKRLDKLLAEQRMEKARTPGAKDIKERKRRGMMQVRNPNPREGGFIWVPYKAKNVEKVQQYVPSKREPKTGMGRDYLD
jgi:hypothetical protein